MQPRDVKYRLPVDLMGVVANSYCPILVAVLRKRLAAVEIECRIQRRRIIACCLDRRLKSRQIDLPVQSGIERDPAAFGDDRGRFGAELAAKLIEHLTKVGCTF